MSPRDWKIRVQDILDAIRNIQEYTKGATLESLQQDRKSVDAVVCNLTIIGEATRHVTMGDVEYLFRSPAKALRPT